MKTLKLCDTLDFGKFKGMELIEVCERSPGYLRWAIGKEIIKIDKPTMKYLNYCLEEEKSNSILELVF